MVNISSMVGGLDASNPEFARALDHDTKGLSMTVRRELDCVFVLIENHSVALTLKHVSPQLCHTVIGVISKRKRAYKRRKIRGGTLRPRPSVGENSGTF
jgi:hypothetical protein